jgi:hypothetical protein
VGAQAHRAGPLARGDALGAGVDPETRREQGGEVGRRDQ